MIWYRLPLARSPNFVAWRWAGRSESGVSTAIDAIARRRELERGSDGCSTCCQSCRWMVGASWLGCCRAAVSNFGSNHYGMFIVPGSLSLACWARSCRRLYQIVYQTLGALVDSSIPMTKTAFSPACARPGSCTSATITAPSRWVAIAGEARRVLLLRGRLAMH